MPVAWLIAAFIAQQGDVAASFRVFVQDVNRFPTVSI
jgi:hypothetical protein